MIWRPEQTPTQAKSYFGKGLAMRPNKLLSQLIPVWIIILWSVSLLSAQVTTATFYVIVVDSSGAIIPAATVALREEATGVVRQQTCDEAGECSFTFLLPGSYIASITAPSFKTLEVSGIRIDAAQNLRRKFTLDVGAVVEKVSVSGEAPIVNTVSPEQVETANSATLSELPVAHRMVSGLLQIGTSVSRTSGTGNTAGSFRLNGLGPGATSITMDGIPASAHPGSPQGGFRGGFNYIEVASMEAVQEVDVSKGVFSAEYGRAMSGNINIITKSGTNKWHGSLFELFNADNLNARAVLLASRPPSTFNQFGGSLGGPILKDRIFIFGVYEQYSDRRATTVNAVVPTPSLRSAMLANVPAYKLFLDQFFLPNQPYAAGASTGQYIGPGSIRADDKHYEIKPDAWITSNSRLSATFVSDSPNFSQPLGAAADFVRHYDGNLDRFNVTYLAFRAAWSAETRYGWNRVNNQRTDLYYDVVDPSKAETLEGQRRVPGISGLGMSINGGENFIGNAPEWNLEQKVTWHLGSHSLKFGGGIYRHRYGESDLENPVLTYNTAQDLIANTPAAAQFTFGFEPWVGKQLDFGLFLQDDWRVNQKLVLNLGLRYDYFDHMVAEGLTGGAPYLVNASFSNFANFTLTPFRPYDNPYDTHPLNFGPRFGFAYNPDGNGKTAIRGGIGLMQAPVNVSIFEQTGINAQDQPFRVNLSKTDIQALNIQFPSYNEDLFSLVHSGRVAPAYQLVDPHIKAPYAINYTLGIAHAITGTLMLESAFVGNRGVELVQPRYYNQANPITGVRPNPTLGQGRYWDNSDSSIYTSWQTSLRKRYGKNLSGSLHYSWGKTLSYGYGDITYISPSSSLIQDFFNVQANRGRPPQDVAHTVVGSFVYDIPFLAGTRRILQNSLGGWQASGVFTAQTGTPLTVTESSGAVYGRPDLVDPSHAILNSGIQYLNPAAYLPVPISSVSGQQIRPGSAGNGQVISPGLWNFDFSVAKNFKVTERAAFQFRMDMLNSMNHPNLNVIDVNRSSGTFGRRTGATDPRTIQFHLRLAF